MYFSRALTTALWRPTKDFFPRRRGRRPWIVFMPTVIFSRPMVSILRACSQASYRAGNQRVSRYLREIRSEFERSDVNAQLLRVRLMASGVADVRLNEGEASEEAASIMEFQFERPW